MERIIIEADGGSRGNPGPAGSGAVLIDADTGEVVLEIAKSIGVATNNVAEYNAVLAALTEARKINASAKVLVRMDSKLVIEQLAGNWKIKHPDMRSLAIEVQSIAAGMNIEYQWIPREQNSRADALANKAMDELVGSVVELSSRMHPSVTEFNRELPSSVRAPGNVDAPLTTVILVRHGRTVLTESRRISGRDGENPSLSEQGREDARLVAQALSKVGKSGVYQHIKAPVAVVTSPIARTKETAEAIADVLGVQVEMEPDIAEISFGVWDGHTNAEVAEKWPEQWAAWRGSWTVSPPNGESLADFDARVSAARERIVDSYAGQTVVAVSHVMPIRSFIRYAYEGGISAYWSTQIAPCSITILRLWGSQAVEVVTVNDTNHL